MSSPRLQFRGRRAFSTEEEKKRLRHGLAEEDPVEPFLLGVQGFLVGAILFAATRPETLEGQETAPAAVAARETR